jgi:predicted adenylyl cyclase CyaB
MEIEIRAKLQNVDSFKSKLTEKGAKLVKSKELTDYYFGSLELYEKLGRSFWIRVRKEGESLTLAYKGPTETDGVYEEYEQELQDLETSLKIFEKSGLENAITVTKKRETYKFENYTIVIDDFGPERGVYTEIEVISDVIDKTGIHNFMLELGIDEKDIFHKGFITKFLNDMNSPYSKWVTG